MLNVYCLLLPENYLRVVASAPDLHSALFRSVTDISPHSTNVKL
jgi:hypothetical protein